MAIKENKDLIRKHVDVIILTPLLDRDCYGYEILNSIEENSSGLYAIKQPTLYSCLKRLEQQGKIDSYLGDISQGAQRRYYTLTDLGKNYVLKYRAEWEYVRTILSSLISDKEFDKDMDPVPFEASDLRPLTKRTRQVKEVAEQEEPAAVSAVSYKEEDVIEDNIIEDEALDAADDIAEEATQEQEVAFAEPEIEEIKDEPKEEIILEDNAQDIADEAEEIVAKEDGEPKEEPQQEEPKEEIVEEKKDTPDTSVVYEYSYYGSTISMTQDQINKFTMDNYIPKEYRSKPEVKQVDADEQAREALNNKKQQSYMDYISRLSKNIQENAAEKILYEENLDSLAETAEEKDKKDKPKTAADILFLNDDE